MPQKTDLFYRKKKKKIHCLHNFKVVYYLNYQYIPIEESKILRW